jgi:hypothetical protein
MVRILIHSPEDIVQNPPLAASRMQRRVFQIPAQGGGFYFKVAAFAKPQAARLGFDSVN